MHVRRTRRVKSSPASSRTLHHETGRRMEAKRTPPRRQGPRQPPGSDDPRIGYGSSRTGLDLASVNLPLHCSPAASPLRGPRAGGGEYNDDNWRYTDPPELSRRDRRRRGSAGGERGPAAGESVLGVCCA